MTGGIGHLSRRQAILGGALSLAFWTEGAGSGWARIGDPNDPGVGKAGGPIDPTLVAPGMLTGFVRIEAGGRILLVMPSAEMGQGIYTAEAMLLAEELEVGLDQVELVAAPADAVLYAQPRFKAQLTGGSTSIRGF